MRHLLGLLGRLLGIRVFSAARFNLRDIEIDLLIGVVSLQQALQQLPRRDRVRFLAVQHRQRNGHVRSFGRFVERLLRFGDGAVDIVVFAIGVDGQHPRALLRIGIQLPQFLECRERGGKIALRPIGVAQLLVKDCQRAGIPFPARLALDARDGIGQHLYRFVVVALVLIEKRFVVENFQAARRELLGARQTRFGLIELSQPSVKLRGPQEIFRRARLQLRQLVELLERFRVFIFRHQRLRQSVAMAWILRIRGNGLAVGLFRLGVILRLRIRVAQQVVIRPVTRYLPPHVSAARSPPASVPGQSEAG